MVVIFIRMGSFVVIFMATGVLVGNGVGAKVGTLVGSTVGAKIGVPVVGASVG